MQPQSDNQGESSAEFSSASAEAAALRVKGERVSTLAHLAFALVLFLTAVILVAVSHTHGMSKNLDFVKIYNYKKSVPDKGKAVDTIKEYVASADGSWLNDVSATEKCKDMVSFWWPVAGFAAGSTPIAATCDFAINLKLGPMEEQLQIKDITPVVTTGCAAKAGQYSVVFTLPDGMEGTVTAVGGTAPKVTIAADGAITADTTTVLGYGFKTVNSQWQACMRKRQDLSAFMLNTTDCKGGFSSPLCTCVRAFTTRILSWQSKLQGKPDNKMAMGDVVAESVRRCVELRRGHDVREATEHVYARSSALLVFSVALLLNGLLNVLVAFGLLESTLWYAVFFVGYFAAVLLTGLLDNKGSGIAEFETVLAMTLPAFLVHGGYLVLLHAYFGGKAASHEQPFLHPVTFDICLCALSLFTLVERGVVQTEYLVAETLKCHAIAAVYIAVIWYHCYGRGRGALDSEFVQQAYLVLFVVGLVSSGSSAVTPYAIKKPFELHWVLPSALTYIAYVNPGWSVHFRMAAKLNAPPSSAVYNFNAIAGFLSLFVGCLLLSSFLTEYIQIYGAKHFAYPAAGDPLSYAVTRGLILPGAGGVLQPTPLATPVPL